MTTAFLLSICIPTRNRASLLANTLESITAQQAFKDGDQIEIVVTDNCSTDNTQQVVAEFTERFPNKISYYRNQTDTGDRNIGISLSNGRGMFLKCHNDTLMCVDGSLANMIQIIEATKNEKPILFFKNSNSETGELLTLCNNINDFLANASFIVTWIGALGIWREDFDRLDDFSQDAHLKLPQTGSLLRMFSFGKRAIIVNQPYFHTQQPGRKSGYNVAEVFGKNYLSILKPYLERGLISETVYQQEKRKLLVQHIIPYYFDFQNQNDFTKSGFFRYMEDFRADPFFYEAIEQLVFSRLSGLPEPSSNLPVPSTPVAPYPVANPPEGITDRFRQINALWRQMNPHNETFIEHAEGPFDFSKISAGKRSYGPISVLFWGHQDERLTIGHFTSIAKDVTFLLGGNHPYHGISTFPFLVKSFGAEREAQTKGPIVVGDDVWIGHKSLILSGVTIGQGAVIAAGSVVSKDVPPYAIVGGNPAKVIKYRFPEEVIKEVSRINYSLLTEDKIRQCREVLYQPLTADNAKSIVDRIVS
jgi:acetyltransferase-like isoleucine patch superfamily enzyme/glycosyltransferase involved in cell wall biosynthesis